MGSRWRGRKFILLLRTKKTLIIDNATAMIMTFNFTPQYYATSRDFGIFDKDPADISAMETVFDGDWRGIRTTASDSDDLVWSPGSEPTLIDLIDHAQKTLDIYNEEMADPRIIKAHH